MWVAKILVLRLNQIKGPGIFIDGLKIVKYAVLQCVYNEMAHCVNATNLRGKGRRPIDSPFLRLFVLCARILQKQ